MSYQHCPRNQEDEILHDFDSKERVLRILFVGPYGDLTPVTYRLCARCGVTMDEMESQEGTLWSCAICGRETRGCHQ